MKKLTIIAAVFVAGLSACSKTESPPSKAAAASENVQLDLATPDKALKSYWAVRDSVRVKHAELFERAKGDFRSAEKQMGEVADGALVKAFAANSLPFETFTRDLIDVKIESESRAVILTVIKNSTPVPAGGEMSKYDEERRRDGERYRYVLEKSQIGWRVSEIWQWSTYEPKNDWKKFQPGDGKPDVPSLTYYGI